MTATDELKPCPFCGGTEQRVKSSGRWGWFVSCSCCAVAAERKEPRGGNRRMDARARNDFTPHWTFAQLDARFCAEDGQARLEVD